jgi:hypothetical protein
MKTGRGVRLSCCLSLILISVYNVYLTKGALEGFGGFKAGEQVIRTVKYADDLVTLTKEKAVLQTN